MNSNKNIIEKYCERLLSLLSFLKKLNNNFVRIERYCAFYSHPLFCDIITRNFLFFTMSAIFLSASGKHPCISTKKVFIYIS